MQTILLLFLAVGILFAKESPVDIATQQQRVLDSMKLEIEALKRIKLEKANQLEKAEALRWQKRYIQNQENTEYQNETRILEGNYSKISDNMSRAATELGALRNLALEQKEKAVATKNALDNFNLLVKQAIDKNLDEIPQDFPAKIEERLMNFASNPQDLKTYFQDRQGRLKLTETQELSIKDSHRLRLGTVFFADAALGQNTDVKAVMRTGTLSGKVFEWRSALSKEFSADIKQSVLSAQQKADSAWIPIDVL
jgi:biopolymer transport protein ExbB